MNIEKIIINNLASYEGEQRIDFTEEPLKSSGLYSITGPTGSGKSTILDALCLALYGTAPRFESSKKHVFLNNKDEHKKELNPDDPRNILRKGAKQGCATVQFVGNDGVRYVAKWSASVTRNGTFKKVERSLVRFKLEGDSAIEEDMDTKDVKKKNAITEAVGLDYEQFTRTVMLAQNSFANFIKCPSAEKAVLLEKLTGTEIYTRIAEIINGHYKNAKDALDIFKQKQELVLSSILPDDERESRVAAYAQTKKQAEEIEGLITKNELALHQWQRWTKLENEAKQKSARLKEAESLLDEARKAEAEAVKLKEDMEAERERVLPMVKQARTVKQNLQRTVEEVSARQAKCLEMEKNLRQAKSKVDENEKAKNAAEKRVAKAEAVLEALSPYENAIVKSALVCAKLRELVADETKLSKENEAIKSVNEALAKRHTELNSLEAKLLKLEQAVAATAKDLQEAEAARDEKDIDKLTSEADRLSKSYEAFARAATDWTNYYGCFASIATLEDEKQKLKQAKPGLDEKEKNQSERLAALEKMLPLLSESKAALLNLNAETMRSGLEEGQPCPVCGSTEHPFADKCVLDERVNAIVEKIDEAEKEAGTLKMELFETHTELKKLESRLASLDQQLWGKRNDLKGLEDAWEKDKVLDASLACGIQMTEQSSQQRIDFLRSQQKRIADEQQSNSLAIRQYKTLDGKCRELLKKKSDDEQLQKKETGRKLSISKEIAENDATIKSLSKQWSDRNEAIRGRIDELDGIGLDGNWKDQLRRSPAEYVALWTQRRNDYDAAQTSKESGRRALESAKACDEALKENLIRSDEMRKTSEAELKTCKEQADKLQTELESFFDGVDPDAKEKSIEQRTKDARQSCDAAKERRSQKELAKGSLKSELDTLLKQAGEQKENLPESIEVLNDRKQKLAEEKARLAEAAQKVFAVLEQDKDARQKKEAFRKDYEQLEDNYRKWNTLNTLMGAHSGDDMRQMAQCYTLRFLVMQANIYLKMLTARYRLVGVADSLSLRVKDMDYAGLERNLSSLSGGETFLISLSLALGLSAISSGTYNYGMLFIDEGFGTLDNRSLNIVIDALSTLQQVQGKRVCVISHTAEMKERIPVQVRVERAGKGEGKSRIVIG